MLKIKHAEPEYARLDLTAIIRYLSSTVQKISQTDCGGNYYFWTCRRHIWHPHTDTRALLRTLPEMRLCTVFWLPVKKQASGHGSAVI